MLTRLYVLVVALLFLSESIVIFATSEHFHRQSHTQNINTLKKAKTETKMSAPCDSGATAVGGAATTSAGVILTSRNTGINKAYPLPKSLPRGGGKDKEYILSALFAGVGSGALASVACAPLDLIRTRMQVWGDVHTGQHSPVWTILKDTLKKEGWKGYFRGLGATLTTVPLFWGLYFPLYDDFKRRLERNQIFSNPSLAHCSAAISAGCIADVVCNPMFVVRTRMQTEALHLIMTGAKPAYKQQGIIDTIGSLYKEGGVPIFWKGMTASLMGLSHVAIQFPVYEHLKKEARSRSETGEESALDLLISSGLSKVTASLVTYPHEVVRSRMMDSRGPVTLRGTIRRIGSQEGIIGFYSGLHVSLLRVIPNCCITFITYELLLRFAMEKIDARSKNLP